MSAAASAGSLETPRETLVLFHQSHRGVAVSQGSSGSITRRQLLKRGALLGGAVLWTTPLVQVVGMQRASAQVTSPVGTPLGSGTTVGSGPPDVRVSPLTVSQTPGAGTPSPGASGTPGPGASGTPGPSVAGVSVRSEVTASVAGQALPRTGIEAGSLAASGSGLMGAGALILGLVRRLERPVGRHRRPKRPPPLHEDSEPDGRSEND